MPPITGKTCVVVGANRGIGLEFVRQLVARGNTVVATARKPNEASELQEMISGGADVQVTTLDITNEESISAWSSDLRNRVEHVDLLINNAGMLEGSPFSSVTKEEMMRTFELNVCGPLLVTQSLHNIKLLGGRKPSIVANMTSKMGSIADNGSGGYYSYRASKAALNMIVSCMNLDLQSDNITSVLLHPGYVKTGMTRYTGLIDPDEAAAGLLAVLEGDKELGGKWYDFKGQEVPW